MTGADRNDPKAAKARAERQGARIREQSEQSRSWAEWWKEQREQNGFRVILERLVRGA